MQMNLLSIVFLQDQQYVIGMHGLRENDLLDTRRYRQFNQTI